MSQGGYLLIVPHEERGSRIAESIYSRNYFTVVVSADLWRGSQRAVALVSFDSTSISGLCLAERKERVATYQVRLRCSNFIELDESLQFSAIEQAVSKRVQQHFSRVITAFDGGWITPGTWNEVIRAISTLRPNLVDSLDHINSLTRVHQFSQNISGSDVLVREKDAYTSIIRYAGFESVAESSVIAWRSQQSQKRSDTRSFIAAIQPTNAVTIREDQAIEYDATKFGDWEQIQQFVTGERIFSKGKESLMIRNVNRQPLEETLGVDLIYFNHTYRSFILVQYKRMLRESGEYRYRPDSQFAEELKRMQDFRDEVSATAESPALLADYRLNPGAFYFKFHESEVFDPVSASLIKGMHIPLDYWELFDASEHSRGPRGGKYVGYDNIGRYLNNTEFEYMVAKGMVGSYGTVTELLINIVRPLVVDLKHSVTVGIKYRMGDDLGGDGEDDGGGETGT